MKESTKNKRDKKAENRKAKEERKLSNSKKDENKKPNNLLLGVLVFGIILGLFATGFGINYFKKDASIESYIKNNKDMFSNAQVDEMTVVDITAKKNKMTAVMKITTKNEDEIKEVKDYYAGDDAQRAAKTFGAYYLTYIKPSTRALFADAKVQIFLNDEEIQTTSLTYYDALRIMQGTYYNDTEEEHSEDDGHDHSEEAEKSSNDAQAIEISPDDLDSVIEVGGDE